MARPSFRKVVSELRDIARVASVMVDGELAKRIITERAMHYIKNPDPQFKHQTGDYYDVDHANFLLMKKTLLRLEKLADFTFNTSLWLVVPGGEPHVTVAVHNGKLHRYYKFGEGMRPMEPEMSACVSKGEVTLAPDDEKLITVLAPVRDSLGDVAAFVELTAPDPRSKALAPAWS